MGGSETQRNPKEEEIRGDGKERSALTGDHRENKIPYQYGKIHGKSKGFDSNQSRAGHGQPPILCTD